MEIFAIHIIPTRYPERDESAAPATLSWDVDVCIGADKYTRTISDPFSEKDHAECRWYLENHVPVDPFDEGRADRAASSLRRYARHLAQQLGLTLISSNPIQLDVHESLAEVQDTKFSIFRLHWEVLEDARAWGLESLNLRIRRRLPPSISLGSLSVHRRPLGPIPPSHVPRTINILHVVARSRGTTISEPTDISPYLALRVLTQLSEHLREHRCPLKLNITTIRPGTFEALAEHATQLANGGKGEAYHLVHLDVHGQVDKDGAKLFFESSKATEGYNSTEVSDALLKLGVEFVVLNACRSARADLGHDANTAAIFTQRGSGDNVLAMVFETLSGAAELFLRTFYTEFFTRGASFGTAAQRGRMALRKDNVRKGRLNQTLPLSDWFGPVTYSSVPDLAIAALIDTISTDITWGRGLVGRDYDVAVLEKILLKRRKAFLFGHAWIGKTAFLHYARRIWAETSFADEVIYVDLASSSIKDVPSLVRALHPRSVDSTRGANTEAGVDSILQLVKNESKVLVIIDGIDAISTASPVGLGKHKLERNAALQIGDFLKQLYESSKAGHTGSMILFAGRLPPAKLEAGADHAGPLARTNAWLFTAFKSSRSTMELQGLSLVDSLELCEETARQAGQSVPNISEPGTRDNLELLMRLLLGIPGAISPFILATHKNGVPWLSLRNHLLSGDSTTYRTLLSSPETAMAFEELKFLAKSLLPEEYSVMLLIGLFWHQGPYDGRFAEAMVDFGVCADRNTVNNTLSLASERGYIRLVPVEGVKRISFVHPVFTIYCRAILEDLSRQILSQEEGTQSADRQFAALSDENVHLRTAARLYGAIEYRKQKIPGRSINFQFLQWFIENVDYQLMFQLALPDEATNARTSFRVQQDPNAFHFLNGLTCFGLCTDEDRNLAPEDWPLDYFVRFPSMVMSAGTATEATLFSEQLENLLSRYLELKGTDMGGVEIHRSCFILSTVSLVMLRKWHANDPGNRWREFAVAANNLCESSPEKSGLVNWANLVFQLPGIAVSNSPAVDFAAAFEKILDGMPKTSEPQNDRLAESMARGLARSAEEARAARVHITGYPLADHDNPTKQIARDTLLDLVRQGLSSHTDSGNGTEMAEIFNKIMPILASQVGDRPRAGALMFMPRSQSSAIEKHRGNSSSLQTLGDSFDSPSGRLSQIETAMNSGDWASLVSSNSALFLQHLKNGDTRQAFKYFEMVLPALRRNPATANLVEMVEREMKLQQLGHIALGIRAADTDTPHDRAAAMAAVDEMERIISQGPAGSDTQREIERKRIASLRAAAENAAGHSAEDFARMREDFKAMNLPLTGEDAKPEAVLKRMQTSNQTSQLMKEIAEAVNGERDLREGFAKMDQLEELCRQHPIAMFVVVGEEGLAKLRGLLKERKMMIRGMKLEMERREMR